VLVVQDVLHPAEMTAAVESLADETTSSLRIGVAYATAPGIHLLLPRLRARVGRRWRQIRKTILVSLDYGYTQPQALQELADDPDCYEVLVARPSVLGRSGLRPSAAFHAKVYLLDRGDVSGALVGSANLTDRALTINTEAGYWITDATVASANAAWAQLTADSAPLTAALLDQYVQLRPSIPHERAHVLALTEVDETAPVTEAVLAGSTAPAELHTFWEAIEAGVRPPSFDHLWIEAGPMTSGGSHNQLELPRGGNRFFGFEFSAYGDEHEVIGQPVLVAGGSVWIDRPLTWHGHNRMERLNLPTQAQGGYDYAGSAVLFTRTPVGFRLEVAAWESPLAVSWRNASLQLGTTYRLGQAGLRVCGLY